MADPRFSWSSKSAIDARPVSHGELSELAPDLDAGSIAGLFAGRRVDLDGMRRKTPSRWMAFLHAHFPDHIAVAYFFNVDDKTSRNWWSGKNEPRLSAFAAMLRIVPVNARLVIVDFMAEAA